MGRRCPERPTSFSDLPVIAISRLRAPAVRRSRGHGEEREAGPAFGLRSCACSTKAFRGLGPCLAIFPPHQWPRPPAGESQRSAFYASKSEPLGVTLEGGGDGSRGNGQGRPSVGAPCPPLNEIASTFLPVHRSASWKLFPGHQLLAHQLQARAPAAPGVPGWGGGGGAPVMPTESPGVRENQRRPRERKSHPAQRRGRVTLLPRTGPRGGPREAGGNRAASSRPTVRTRLLAGAAHAPGHQVGV